MMTLSTRYVALLLALPAAALLAVWSYSYGAIRSDDCIEPHALLESTWVAGMRPQAERKHAPPSWAFQSIEGTVPSEDPMISPLEIRILRTFEPDQLYGNPLKTFRGSHELITSQITLSWIDAESDRLPVHEVLTEAPRGVRIDAYIFFYDSRPVANPVPAMLSGAASRLRSGPLPLTLVTVSAYASDPLRDEARKLAEEALVSSWEHYRTACRGPAVLE